MAGCAPRDLRAKPFDAKETCHSTKRTHFVFAKLQMYQFYSQILMPFAAAFANGFVLEKRTHFEVVLTGLGWGYRNQFPLRCSPAMEAEVSDHVWSLEEVVGLLKR